MRDIKWFTIAGLVLSAAALVGVAIGSALALTVAVVGLTLVVLDK